MSLPPRQPRPIAGSGIPRHAQRAPSNNLSFEDIAQRALNVAREGARYLPVAGPALDLGEDLEKGNYAGALFNGAMLAADLTPYGPGLKVLRIIRAIEKTGKAPLLARAATQRDRIRRIENLKGQDVEIHHTIPMDGLGRFVRAASKDAEGLWRNAPVNLKIMRKADHHRLTRSWTDPATGNVLPKFNAAQRLWHGTNASQKTTALAAGATIADAVQNRSRPLGQSKTPNRR